MARRNPKAALKAFQEKYGTWSGISSIKMGGQGEIVVHGNTTLRSRLPSKFQNMRVVFQRSSVRKTA